MKPADVSLAVLTSIIWGFAFVATKVALESFSPPQLTALRFLIACLPALLLPRPRIPWPLLILIGLTLFTGQFLLLFFAFAEGLPPGVASVTQQMQAFFTVGLAAVFLGDVPTVRQGVGMTIAMAGLILIGLTVDAGFAEIKDIADRHVENDTPLREFPQRRDRHRDWQRRPQIRAYRGRHQRGGTGHARRRGRPDHGLAIAHMLGKPEGRCARQLGLAAHVQHLGRRREAIEEYTDRHQPFPDREPPRGRGWRDFIAATCCKRPASPSPRQKAPSLIPGTSAPKLTRPQWGKSRLTSLQLCFRLG